MDFDNINLSDDGLGSLGSIQEQFDKFSILGSVDAFPDPFSEFRQATIGGIAPNMVGRITGVDGLEALSKGAFGALAAATAPLRDFNAQVRPALPNLTGATGYLAGFEYRRPSIFTDDLGAFDPPVMPILPELPSDEDDEIVRALEDRVRTLEAEKDSWALRYEALEGACEAQRNELRELKMRRRAYLLDATDEHKPELPVIDSQFPDN